MSTNEKRKVRNERRSSEQEQERYWLELGRQFAHLGKFTPEDVKEGHTHIWACYEMWDAKRKKPVENMRVATLARIIEAAGRRLSMDQLFVSETGDFKSRSKIYEHIAFDGRRCLEWLAETAIACATYDYLKQQAEKNVSNPH